VIPYLSEDDVASLAEELRALGRAAYWIVDYFSPLAIKSRPRAMKAKMQNAPFKFEPADWFGFFEAHGWRRKELRYLAEEAERLKRPMQLPLWRRLIWAVWGLFLSKERREGFQKLVGYALLEPVK
jgi:O-methyltransferase involved in polyketide biosynthesis